METALIEKCWKEPEFKKAVVSDPKGMLERHIGRELPAQLKIVIHEEDVNTLHFSIPPTPSNVMELSDGDLEKVSGGTDIMVTVLGSIVGLVATAMGAGVVYSALGQAGVIDVNKGW